MSDPVSDPLLTAVAITRAQLQTMRGETSTRDAMEASLLEVAAAEDPLGVLTALAMVSAASLVLASGLGSALRHVDVAPGDLLDGIQAGLEAGRS